MPGMRPGVRRSDLLVVATLALAGWAAWWVYADGDGRAQVDRATVAALYLPLIVAVVMVLRWWAQQRRPDDPLLSRRRLDHAVELLAAQTGARWAAAARDWQLTEPAPVLVTWRLRHRIEPVLTDPPAGTVPAPWSAVGPDSVAASRGSVTELFEQVYRRLPYGRLVILGEGSSGKTAAMVWLVLQALEARGPTDPVPVWLTVSGWNPQTQTLKDWVCATLEQDYPALRSSAAYGRRVAADLFTGHRLALFIDGLDEMPAAGRAVVLQAIRREAAQLRVVLTSRPAEYDAARGPDNSLDHPVVVVLQPLSAATAGDYLRRGHEDDTERAAFDALAEHVVGHPDGVVARALDNPLALTLARAAYRHSPDRDPCAELTALGDQAQVRAHLIGRFLHGAYPERRERDHAVGWLSWIAHHVGPGQELAWWQIPNWAPHAVVALVVTLHSVVVVGTIAAGATAAGAQMITEVPPGLWTGVLVGGLAIPASMIGSLGLEAFRDRSRVPGPRSIAPRWTLASAVLALLLVTSSVSILRGGIWGVLGLELTPLLMLITFAQWRRPVADSPAATPLSSYRADRRASVVAGVGFGLVTGLAMVLLSYANVNAAAATRLEVGQGVGLGLLCVLLLGVPLTFLLGPALLLPAVDVALFVSGRGRVRLLPLLEQARERQVLRQVGTRYQFRHAELRDYLVRQTEQPRARRAPMSPQLRRAVVCYAIATCLLGLGLALGSAEIFGRTVEATITDCRDGQQQTGSGPVPRAFCTGEWVLDGRTSSGYVDGVDDRDLGESIPVVVHGSRVAPPDRFGPIALLGLGAVALALGVSLTWRARRPRRWQAAASGVG